MQRLINADRSSSELLSYSLGSSSYFTSSEESTEWISQSQWRINSCLHSTGRNQYQSSDESINAGAVEQPRAHMRKTRRREDSSNTHHSKGADDALLHNPRPPGNNVTSSGGTPLEPQPAVGAGTNILYKCQLQWPLPARRSPRAKSPTQHFPVPISVPHDIIGHRPFRCPCVLSDSSEIDQRCSGTIQSHRPTLLDNTPHRISMCWGRSFSDITTLA